MLARTVHEDFAIFRTKLEGEARGGLTIAILTILNNKGWLGRAHPMRVSKPPASIQRVVRLKASFRKKASWQQFVMYELFARGVTARTYPNPVVLRVGDSALLAKRADFIPPTME